MVRGLTDTHCHLHEYSDDDVISIARLGIRVVAVSDDYSSSLRTLRLWGKHRWVIPAVGLHPWNVGRDSVRDAQRIVELAELYGVKFLGEIGLDRRFVPQTIDAQQRAFREFLEYARGKRVALSIHTVNTWREVLELLERFDIYTAVLHWYTGPLELLERVRDMGMFIGVNPAIELQEKHRRVVASAPPEILVPESDGPYRYRGVELHPSMITRVVHWIAKLRGLSYEEALDLVMDNTRRLLHFA